MKIRPLTEVIHVSSWSDGTRQICRQPGLEMNSDLTAIGVCHVSQTQIRGLYIT